MGRARTRPCVTGKFNSGTGLIFPKLPRQLSIFAPRFPEAELNIVTDSRDDGHAGHVLGAPSTPSEPHRIAPESTEIDAQPLLDQYLTGQIATFCHPARRRARSYRLPGPVGKEL
jgi:hypothetical protein